MLKPTTVRMPDDFLKELNKFIRDRKLDKSAYLRDILRKGFDDDRRERLLSEYQAGRASLSDVCEKSGISVWEFFDILRANNITANVTLEDWLDSRGFGKKSAA